MATTREALSYALAPVFAAGFPGVIDRTTSIDLAALTSDADYAFVADDVIKVFKLPQGAKLLYARLETDVLDDNGGGAMTATVEAYDGTTTHTLLTLAANFFEAEAMADSRDATYNSANVWGSVLANPDFYVRFKVGTGATGDAAASAKIKVSVGYSLNVESDEYQRTFPTSNPTTVTVS